MAHVQPDFIKNLSLMGTCWIFGQQGQPIALTNFRPLSLGAARDRHWALIRHAAIASIVVLLLCAAIIHWISPRAPEGIFLWSPVVLPPRRAEDFFGLMGNFVLIMMVIAHLHIMGTLLRGLRFFSVAKKKSFELMEIHEIQPMDVTHYHFQEVLRGDEVFLIRPSITFAITPEMRGHMPPVGAKLNTYVLPMGRHRRYVVFLSGYGPDDMA